jgi:hypothetical protein
VRPKLFSEKQALAHAYIYVASGTQIGFGDLAQRILSYVPGEVAI